MSTQRPATSLGVYARMFGIPARTEFDLNFRLFGMPVRITPFFWVMAAFLGSNLGNGGAFVVWILAVMVSILVHEFGHALTARWFGESPEVILYEFGGLCVYDQSSLRHPWKRFLVIAFGPGAGFLLLGVLLGVLSLYYQTSPINIWNFDFPLAENKWAYWTLRSLFWINLFWGLLNLLPVFPLDGGQMTSIVLGRINPRNGVRWATVVSLLTAGLVAIYFAQRQAYMNAIMFGLLAFRSYQSLQAMHYQARYGDSFEQDDDWWKR